MRLLVPLAIGLIVAPIAGGVQAQAIDPAGAACPVHAKSMARLELFFGAKRASGASVTREDWEGFVDAQVTPRFPDGLTWFEGRGQWRGRDGAIVKEETRMLVVWAELGERTEAAIEAIRAAYRSAFDQGIGDARARLVLRDILMKRTRISGLFDPRSQIDALMIFAVDASVAWWHGSFARGFPRGLFEVGDHESRRELSNVHAASGGDGTLVIA